MQLKKNCLTCSHILGHDTFRYDKKRNPEGKWFKGQSHLGELYYWVYHKKKEKRKMDLVIEKFNKTKLRELKAEGFPIE